MAHCRKSRRQMALVKASRRMIPSWEGMRARLRSSDTISCVRHDEWLVFVRSMVTIIINAEYCERRRLIAVCAVPNDEDPSFHDHLLFVHGRQSELSPTAFHPFISTPPRVLHTSNGMP